MTTSKNTHDIPAKAAMPQPTPAFDLPAGEPLSKGGGGPWSTRVGAARAEWTKISADELLKTNGQAADLASLVEKRYGVKRAEADGQVARFLARHNV